jgi:hypothetical protein
MPLVDFCDDGCEPTIFVTGGHVMTSRHNYQPASLLACSILFLVYFPNFEEKKIKVGL